MAPNNLFHFEVEKSKDKDAHGNQVTTIKCHGKLVSDTASQMKEAVKRGRIVIDLGDLTYLDSSGLGTLVGLKASAINQGLCILEFANMTPRVMDLLRITRLTQMFSS
jgi:anti-sigma B factor antagonist